MVTYQITDIAWLTYEVSRVRGVLLVHMERGKEYTVEELLTMLADYGLDYSNPEYVGIGQVLVAEGVIEVV